MSAIELVRELEELDAQLAPLIARREALRKAISAALGLGPSTTKRGRPVKEDGESPYLTVRERIRIALADGPQKAAQIIGSVGTSYAAIQSELSRGARDGCFRRVGVGVYALQDQD
jgi:hypothetical protein